MTTSYLIRGPGLLLLAVTLFPAHASGSNCYDHYNPAAWKGKGLAIVFCRNNSDATKGSYIAQCELRYHKGAKIKGLTRHGSLDKGRVLYADYNTTGAKYTFAVDVVCKTKAAATMTFTMASGAKYYNGCCQNKQYGSVACCGTGGTVTPDAGPKADLPSPPDMVSGTGHKCKDLLSKTHGAALVQLKAGSSAKASFSISGLPAPSGLSKAALVLTLDDADHPGKEGWIRINGKGPLQLPASAAWNNVKVTASAALPLGYLSSGTNTVTITSNSSPFGVGNVRLRVWGPACNPKKPDAKVWTKDQTPPGKDQAPPGKDQTPPGKDQTPPGKDSASANKDSAAPAPDSAADGAEGPDQEVSGGCSCRASTGLPTGRWPLWLLAGLLLLGRWARRRGWPGAHLARRDR